MGRLEAHYEAKYADTPAAPAIPLTNHPRDRNQAVAMAVLSCSGDSYLEIGAGNGAVAQTVRERFPRMTLTEISGLRAEKMRAEFGEGVTVLCHNIDVDPLPMEERTVDVAVMNALIEHLVDPIDALRRIHAVLKPGGRLVVMTPNIAKWTRRVKLLTGKFPSTASTDEGLRTYYGGATDLYDEGHLHYFTFRSLEQIAYRAGFASSQRMGFGGQLARFWPTMFSDICITLIK